MLLCQFEPEFLSVPPECLILTMKANQKYFPLLDGQGALTNKFLVVSNISPEDPSAVIQGNERVVRPRLADAKFFFDQDRKKTLESRVPGLDKVVYHAKLGTMGERYAACSGHRAGRSASSLVARLWHAQAERAALLAKADLLTDMVGEFPELQGVMGGYYARHDGETEASRSRSKTTTSRASRATNCRATTSASLSRWPTSSKRWSACSASARHPPATRIRSRCADRHLASLAC